MIVGDCCFGWQLLAFDCVELRRTAIRTITTTTTTTKERIKTTMERRRRKEANESEKRLSLLPLLLMLSLLSSTNLLCSACFVGQSIEFESTNLRIGDNNDCPKSIFCSTSSFVFCSKTFARLNLFIHTCLYAYVYSIRIWHARVASLDSLSTSAREPLERQSNKQQAYDNTMRQSNNLKRATIGESGH